MSRSAFILSSGRTGTKFLADFFDANYPDVVARHEPAPSYHLRILSNARAAGLAPKSMLGAALRLSRPALRDAKTGLYIESNPFLYGFVDALPQLDPPPTIIHIVRDPRTYVSSAINHGGSTGIKALATALIPFWFPPVGRGLTPVEMFAGEWSVVNRFLVDHGSALPGYHLLRYEDIFDQSNSGLTQLCALLGLDAPSEASPVSVQDKINAGRLGLMGPWPSWTREDCAAVERVCGDLMRIWGYGEEPEWKSMAG